MKKEELEEKYGEKLIDQIFKKGLLNGCTMGINDDETDDIYEIDIINAIRIINGDNFVVWD